MIEQLELFRRGLTPHIFPASPVYVAGACLLAVLYWLVIPRTWRAPLLLVVSLCHALLLTSWQLVLLGALLLFVHWRVGPRRPSSVVRAGLWWTLGLLVSAFVALKLPLLVASALRRELPIYLPVAAVAADLALPIGASYCLFRLIHYAVELERGRFEPAPLHRLALYVLFFPTYRAGPIERYDRFVPAQRLTGADLNAGLARVIAGLVKKIFLADLLLGAMFYGWLQHQTALPALWIEVLRWYGVTVLVYLDFSGYSDLAIGLGRLFGYRIVENFDYPFLSANIAQFWRRWHISLHTVIRDYFFFPLFGRATSHRKIMAGLFLSFVCSQLWHALSLNFLAAGAYHGLLVVLWSLYERWQLRRGHKPSTTPLSRVGGALLTFQLVTAGLWLFFWGQAPHGMLHP